MNTIKFSVEGIGEFLVLEELSALQAAKVNLKVSNFFGADHLTLLKNRTEFESVITQRILDHQFPSRAFNSLTEEERAQFDSLFEKDESDEAILYRQCNYQLNRINFLFSFPEVCVRQPDGFKFDETVANGREIVLDKIWVQYLKATAEIADKKKLSSSSLTSQTKNGSNVQNGKTG